MDEADKFQLADFSEAVRESTLKRLRSVPQGLENWRYKDKKMSFSDLACHLLECDNWMFRTLNFERLDPVLESHFISRSRSEYDGLLAQLSQTGLERSSLIRSYSEEDFRRNVYDTRVCHDVTVWWIIVRGNLDHEIHHRGQLSILLNLVR